MPFNADAVTLTLIALIAVISVGIVAYAVRMRTRDSQDKRAADTIQTTIVDYFRRSGVQVEVDCVSTGRDGRYTAMVESEPMKRFRLSHIIEMTLREHVRKTCNLELDKIYWRFPVNEATQAAVVMPRESSEAAHEAATEERQLEESSDEYINEGLENYRHIPQPEVTELPWETFEQVATLHSGKDGRQTKQ